MATLASPALALIIDGGDGTGNTTNPVNTINLNTGQPFGDPGWNNVVQIGNSSGDYAGGVYLGGGWILTADHVTLGSTSVTYDGNTYSAVPGSLTQLIGGADLAVFRISAPPPSGALSLTIASSTPSVGTTVMGIGFGRSASATGSWDSNWNPTSNPSSIVYTGFYYPATGGATQTKRWGADVISSTPPSFTDGYGGSMPGIVTTFNSSNPNSMQVDAGDSGGALFAYVGNSWELAGIIVGYQPFVDQPADTAVLNETSYSVDLSAYSSQIIAAVPEPHAVPMLAGLAGMGLLAFWRRRVARRRSAAALNNA
jgi:MYXO-CTERM domain-containing protein